jgi:peptidoglycan/LPS O-acetylase OafA/YrhL
MFMTSIILVGLFFVLSNHQVVSTECDFGSLTHTGILKGLGVFLVVINHIGARSGYRYFQPFGGIGVSLFLICSGYGLMKSFQRGGFDHYFKHKILKVLVPFWIVYIIYSLCTQPSLELLSVLKGLLLVESFGIFWFIQYLFLFYMFFFIAFSFFKQKTGTVFLVTISCLVFLTSPTLLLGEQAFAFVIGVFLAQMKIEFSKPRLLFLSALFLSIGLLSLFLKQTEWIREGSVLLLNLNGALIKSCCALGLLFLVALTLVWKFWKIFTLPGKLSLEIYLVHVTLTNGLLSEFTMLNVLVLILFCYIGVVLLHTITNVLAYLIKKRIPFPSTENQPITK